MSRLRLKISMSLDGFVAGPGQSIQNPLGVGGNRLHEWAFELRAFRQMLGMEGGGVLNAIQGTLIISGLAALIAIPPAVLAAFYAANNPNTPLGVALRFSTDVLAGVVYVAAAGLSLVYFFFFLSRVRAVAERASQDPDTGDPSP